MITYNELEAKARKYAAARTLTTGQRDDLLFSLPRILRDEYTKGFMQGYTCAGGVLSAAEAADAAKEQSDE